ncbi:hypothetical protein M752DRAFT_83659 [Aspergillus phoenicis ATCC 13157]|nr:hypothetical protein M752DRAFT_83659 [Aspergillus phoenicis ATCC 13157]
MIKRRKKKRERGRDRERERERAPVPDKGPTMHLHGSVVISSHLIASHHVKRRCYSPHTSKRGRRRGTRVVVRDDRRGSSKSERELHIRQGSPITNVPEQTVEPGGAGNYRNQRQRAKRERWGGKEKESILIIDRGKRSAVRCQHNKTTACGKASLT